MDHKVFESEEIQNIFRAMGVTIGTEEDPKELNLSKLRYHKVIIMTDADVDGSHIATLILTGLTNNVKHLSTNMAAVTKTRSTHSDTKVWEK